MLSSSMRCETRNERQRFFFKILCDVERNFDLVFISGQVISFDGQLDFSIVLIFGAQQRRPGLKSLEFAASGL